MTAFASWAAVKRKLTVGTRLIVVEHWSSIPQLQGRPGRAGGAPRDWTGTTRVITAASGTAIKYRVHDEQGEVLVVDQVSQHVPASKVTLHEDGSWSVDHGPVRAGGEEFRKVVRLRIVR